MRRVEVYVGEQRYAKGGLHYVGNKDVVHRERDTYTITNKKNANKVEKWLKKTLMKIVGKVANVTPYERHERIKTVETVSIDLSNLEEEIASQVHRIKEQGGEVDFVVVGLEEEYRLRTNNKVVEYMDEIEYRTMRIEYDRGVPMEEYHHHIFGINIRVVPWLTGAIVVPKPR